MKKYLVCIMLFVNIAFLFGIRNWQAYTNTSAIYKIRVDNNKLLLPSWGGVSTFSVEDLLFEKDFILIDGLSDSDIVDVLKSENTTYYVTQTQGVDIFKKGKKAIPCNQTTGLVSNNAKNIAIYTNTLPDSSVSRTMFVGTDEGISIFEINDEFPYPLFIQNLNESNHLQSNKINSLVIDNEGYLYIGSRFGLSIVHADSLQSSSKWKYYDTYNTSLINNEILDIAIKGDTIALATKSGLYKSTKPALFHNNLLISYFPFDAFNAVFIDQNNDLWASFGYISESTGFYVVDPEFKQFVYLNENEKYVHYHSNPQDPVFITDFASVNNIIWASTWGEGIYSVSFDGINDFDIVNYKQKSVSSNAITKLCIDKNSTLWVADGYMGGPALARGTRGVSSFDGSDWHHYTYKNSSLISNNILRIAVDNQNRKWFGSWDRHQNPWGNGVSVLNDADPQNPVWHNINTGLISNTISEIAFNPKDNNMWIASSQSGINVINPSYHIQQPVYLSLTNSQDPVTILFDEDRTFIGTQRYGLVYWDDASTPLSGGAFWKRPAPTPLLSGYTYGITSYKSEYERQYWFAMQSGLYMFNGSNWYEYTVSRKRKIWNAGNFFDETYYFADEERLFAGNPSTPSCILADPFGRVWIGTLGQGISVYDTQDDKYININIHNSPLLSNYISDLSYDPLSGNMYIATNKGLNSVEIGKQYKTNKKLGSIVAYPNPFRPGLDSYITFKNTEATTMPIGSNSCKIFDLNGQIVRELKENRFFEFEWDGKSVSGKDCASGIYFYLIETSEGTRKGKFVIIR
ncbi:MAG TPA: T9SS type A sorting domain-containing protein [Candidatus Cloacimonadota bacterium]|nr:T9SS type A sorting domain-containing protein [Candidatus Cloacimonadota bacterium]